MSLFPRTITVLLLGGLVAPGGAAEDQGREAEACKA